jgi:hypothetical protein
MVPLRMNGGGDVDIGSTHLLIRPHEYDHFSFNMCLNTTCSQFVMLDYDAMLFGFDAVSTGHFVLI